MAGKLNILKSTLVELKVGGESIRGVIHIVKNDGEDPVRVTDCFETLRDLGYAPSHPNSLKSLRGTKLASDLLTTKSKENEYIISFKKLNELDQVRILYPTGRKSDPIGLIGSDPTIVKGYRVESGCSIAVLSGEKAA